MKKSARPRYEAWAKIIKAMAHPSRLLIIEELQLRERCVNELTEMVGADTSTVSKHLSVMKSAGLVSDEKRGLQVFYTLRVPCATSLFSCIEGVVKSNAEAQMAAL